MALVAVSTSCYSYSARGACYTVAPEGSCVCQCRHIWAEAMKTGVFYSDRVGRRSYYVISVTRMTTQASSRSLVMIDVITDGSPGLTFSFRYCSLRP